MTDQAVRTASPSGEAVPRQCAGCRQRPRYGRSRFCNECLNEQRRATRPPKEWCSKCGANPRHLGSSWCKLCLNAQAAEYRARTRPRPTTEQRVCAYTLCDVMFTWRSRYPKTICCSKSHMGKHRAEKERAIRLAANPDPPTGFILCTVCGETKPVEDFSPSRQHFKRSWCRPCSQERSGKWARENADRRSSATRRFRSRKLLRRYGAPSDDEQELLALQGGGCACCGTTDPGHNAFNVDHDHAKPESESYRGLLCYGCNVGLGAFGDDPVRLRAAIAYLERAA